MSPPQRVEVWKVRFDPSVGAEIGKSRPAVVVSLSTAGKLPLRIVVPLTEWKPKYVLAPWMVFVQATPMSGLSKNSAADAFQVKSVSASRFEAKWGELSDDLLDDITAAVAACIGAP